MYNVFLTGAQGQITNSELNAVFDFVQVSSGDIFSGCAALHSHHTEMSVYARSKRTGVDPGFQQRWVGAVSLDIHYIVKS